MAVLCVVVGTVGSTPQVAGAMMLYTQAGSTFGTVGGGGCLEAEVRTQARSLILAGGSITCRLRLDHDLSVRDGMICGGEMTAIVVSVSPDRATECLEVCERVRRGEPVDWRLEATDGHRMQAYAIHLEPNPSVIIAGAGHVGVEVAWQAQRVGFAVTILDDRADFLLPERFPPGATTIVGPIPETLERLAQNQASYVVIATRGHKDDLEAITMVVRRPLRYLGMLGSRRKIVTLFKELRRAGATDQDLARISTPIGLDLGAETPAEIALSIVAQMVLIRRRKSTDLTLR